jgi:putative ABC transport system permease protein
MKNNQFLQFALLYSTRSLWRNKRRTALIIGTVALSVTVSIVSTRYSKAVLKIWKEAAINNGAGHAQVHVDGFYDHPDIVRKAYSFAPDHPVEKLLLEDQAVAAISRRLIFEGIISSAGKTIYFLGRAVDAGAELKVSPDLFSPGSDKGSFVPAGASNGIVIGKGLAETLSLSVGDDATILAHTLSGSVNGTDVRVVGIVDPPLPSLSKRLVYMNVEAGQKALQIPGRYTELAIRLKPGQDADLWVAAMVPKMQAMGLDLRGWWQIDPIIRHAEKVWDSVLSVISLLLFLSAGISVLNIVYMLVSERIVEIGTLMAIGAKSRDIRALFTLEACMIGVLGGATGAFVGNVILVTMDIIGVPFDSPFGSGILMVHPKMDVLVTVAVAVAGVMICYLAALAPARGAAKVEPVVAFRGQIT